MVQVEAGAGVGLGDAVVQLHAGMTALVKAQKAIARAVEHAMEQPNGADFQASAPYPASGVLVFDLGGPALGYVWELRRISFFEADNPTTSIAGTGWIFTGTTMGPSAGLPGSEAATGLPVAALAGQQFVDRTGTNMPTSGFYNAGMVPLRYPEHLLAVVTAGTTGVLYAVSGTAAQFSDPSSSAPLVM